MNEQPKEPRDRAKKWNESKGHDFIAEMFNVKNMKRQMNEQYSVEHFNKKIDKQTDEWKTKII